MARRSETTHAMIKVSLPLADRDWLVEEAHRRGTSVNAVSSWAIMRMKEQGDLYALAEIVTRARHSLEPLNLNAYERRLYGEALGHAREIVETIKPLLPTIADKSVDKLKRNADAFDRAFSALVGGVGEKIVTTGAG